MTDQPVASLAQPICEAINLVLPASVGRDPGRAARQRLGAALRATFDVRITGWHVRRVPGKDRLEYDIMPPAEGALSVDDAWNLSYALAELPDVVSAEPAFRVTQDAAPVVAPTATPTGPIPTPAAAPKFENCADDQAPVSLNPNQIDWSPRLVDAPCAWQLAPPPPAPGFAAGQRRGQNIRVGHPDSGYRRHPDLFGELPGQPVRVLTNLERDFVDNYKVAENPAGGHGLNTAGVLMSSDLTGFIVGVAPAAQIVPLRVTKPRLGIPAPVLFESGIRALRDAIRYAVDEAGCQVISISLGWFGNGSLHNAVREAEAKNVIVCAASGNYVPIVVWPAAYAEVIAVAGCDAQRRPWPGASTGPQVDVSGPAAHVWVAGFSAHQLPSAAQSDGTSFATATVAGIAALWLAYHGRDYLLHRYHGEFTLTNVFRYILGVSSDSFAVAANGYGVGIVNARRVLTTPLPAITDLQAAAPLFAAAPSLHSPVDTIAAVFPQVPRDVLRMRLARLLQIPEAELDTRLVGVEDEVLFQVATNPAVRDQLSAPAPSAEAYGIAPASTPAPGGAATLAPATMSNRLRKRVG